MGRLVKTPSDFPFFDECFPAMNQFILELVKAYRAGRINSWTALDGRVRQFFRRERMDGIEAKVPGWKKMSAYAGGVTLTHVTCVFLGMFMLEEFQALSAGQQQLAKWFILFHDIDKNYTPGKKDTTHAFNSAVIAANTLPHLGFPVESKYQERIRLWSEATRQAFLSINPDASPKPDNSKLPEILSGIDELFGPNSPASLIVKTVLLHISLDADKNYPTAAPLTDDEITRFIDMDTLPLLKVMYLADNEGWALFKPEIRELQKQNRIRSFARYQKLIDLAK
jgi:hypothetical protein